MPFGKVAFFPGELVHTNEVLVAQGQHLVEVSTSHAAAMLGRRAAHAGALLLLLLPDGGSTAAVHAAKARQQACPARPSWTGIPNISISIAAQDVRTPTIAACSMAGYLDARLPCICPKQLGSLYASSILSLSGLTWVSPLTTL